MVCNRCIMAVEGIMDKHHLPLKSIALGEVELENEVLPQPLHQALTIDLKAIGFELIEDRKQALVNQIKAAIIELVHYNHSPLKINLSAYLTEKLQTDYTLLAATFSQEKESTIEKFYIKQKVERAKELISYGELSLSEIAFQLNYSSVAHFSAQFKKETGLTPSVFKQQTERRTLDKI